MKTIKIKGIECENESDAVGWVDASGGGAAISVGNKVMFVSRAEAERVAALGVEFAYLFDHEMPDGSRRIMTVPVND